MYAGRSKIEIYIFQWPQNQKKGNSFDITFSGISIQLRLLLYFSTLVLLFSLRAAIVVLYHKSGEETTKRARKGKKFSAA